MGIWTKKSIAVLQAEAAGEEGEHTLKRALGALNLTTLGIGAIIGAGIFVLTGTAAAQYAGPAIVYSFILAGLGCLFAGLCYAEFAAMIPIAGSAYTYGYATLGELIAWIIGWDLILEYLFGAATVAVGWSGYFSAFMNELGLQIPVQFTGAPLDVDGTHNLVASQICYDPATNDVIKVAPARFATRQVRGTQGVINLPAMVLVGLMTILLVIGIKESARFNNIIVIVKLAIVLLVIGFGFMYVNSDNWHPFIPANTGDIRAVRLERNRPRRGRHLLRLHRIRRRVDGGAGGEESAARHADRNSRLARDLYRALHPDVAGHDGPHEATQNLNVPHPVFVAIEAAGPALALAQADHQHRRDRWTRIGRARDAHGAAANLLLDVARRTAAAGLRQGSSEVPDAVRHHDPHRCRLRAVIAGLFPIGLLGELVSIGTLLAFVIVCAGIIVLR